VRIREDITHVKRPIPTALPRNGDEGASNPEFRLPFLPGQDGAVADTKNSAVQLDTSEPIITQNFVEIRGLKFSGATSAPNRCRLQVVEFTFSDLNEMQWMDHAL
jgi:hypothetical protein